MTAITRLGLYGGPRAPYGSFAGKTEQEVVVDTAFDPANSTGIGAVLGRKEARRLDKAREEFERRERKWKVDLRRIIEDAYEENFGEKPEEITPQEVKKVAKAARAEVLEETGMSARSLPYRDMEELVRLFNELLSEYSDLQKYRKARYEDDLMAVLLMSI